MRRRFGSAIAGAVLALAACGEGHDANDVSEFVEACLSSSNLDRPICECAAKKASEELSSDAFAFLLATLGENEAAAAELRTKLDLSEAAAAGMFMATAPAQCAEELAGS